MIRLLVARLGRRQPERSAVETSRSWRHLAWRARSDPSRLGEEPLQGLSPPVLGANHQLGISQPSQRLVPLRRQQQALRVAAKAIALIQFAKAGD
jgi:hypothetical protein